MAGFIDLRAGQRLNVMPARGALAGSYSAIVRRVSEDGLSIEQPRRGDQRLELKPGDEVTLVVQLHGHVYTFRSTVQEVQDIPLPVVLLARPSEVERQERRQFYRLLTNLTPSYAARTDSEGEEIEALDVRILDISGGGAHLRVRQWIPVGARVRLRFSLDDDPVDVDVTVLALAVQRPDVRRSYYRVNSKFIDVERDLRERIIRYIFRQQVELQKKWLAS